MSRNLANLELDNPVHGSLVTENPTSVTDIEKFDGQTSPSHKASKTGNVSAAVSPTQTTQLVATEAMLDERYERACRRIC